ncbi:hypothetical protein B0J14DRAFT_150130 [Halenospora varia]|nr:hypothetical protein B0J14DRAFT_150130 [Halenospora varia]
MAPLTEFHLFPNLPRELRFKIWNYLFHDQRTLEIDCKRRVELGHRYADAFLCKAPANPALLTCQESRQEALYCYTACFRTDKAPNCTYINFDCDTLKFKDNMLLYLKQTELEGMQRMIVEVRDILYFAHYNIETIMKMKKLKSMEILTTDGEMPWGRGNYGAGLIRDFEGARFEDPGWECPSLEITNIDNGNQLGFFAGGALKPGWTPEDGPYDPDSEML